MKRLAFCALFLVFPLAAAAGQQPASQPAAGQAAPAEVDRKAEAYSNFILGHMSEMNYEDTGDQQYASQAIQYYKKAQALDPDSVEIAEHLAEIYAESQQLRDAIQTAQDILKAHPDNVDTHRLLARIYVRTLGDLGQDTSQKQTLGQAVDQYQAVLKLDPSDNEAALWLARLYRFQNQPEKAEQVLEQLLNHDPSNQQALEQYTQLLLDEGHADDAVKRLEKVAGGSGSGRLYDLLGDAYAQMHDNAHAEQAYRRAVQLEPGLPAHLRRLAQTLFDEDKFDEAAKQYGQLTQLEPSEGENYLRLAEIYYQQKKYDQAEASISQAKQRAPENLEVIYNEAIIAEAQGRFADAIGTISNALTSLKGQPASGPKPNPGVYGILYEELGRLYRQQANYPAAIDTFKQLLALGPAEQHRARQELIETYRENNQIDAAIEAAQEAITAYPQDREMKITHALLLGEKEQTDGAVSSLKALLDGTSADREIYLDIAQVDQRGHRYADAEQAAHTAESMSQRPGENGAAYFVLGAIYERQKKYDQAEQEFRKALEVNPNDAAVLNYYGYMLAERSVRLDEAGEMVKRALAIDANNSAYLDSLGWVYYKQNRLTDAREFLLKATTRSPSDPTILGHLGEVYDRLGETDRAIASWEKALEQWRRAVPADYDSDTVRDIEKRLGEAKSRMARKNPSAAFLPH
ncbi:MAG TPA: tetratricopeptide repeat protein [Candidatus Acidoferrales bacterium]|nr:tetratricopeptide repeat protein [Candidatus Acidoferrales bacterium]